MHTQKNLDSYTHRKLDWLAEAHLTTKSNSTSLSEPDPDSHCSRSSLAPGRPAMLVIVNSTADVASSETRLGAIAKMDAGSSSSAPC